MRQTIKHLLEGDANITKAYRLAAERWEEIYQRPDARRVEHLAKILSAEQDWFEHNCGFRSLGQEIMAVSGFARLYTIEGGFKGTFGGEGTTGTATQLLLAFRKSTCSDVKYIAEDVAAFYGLSVPDEGSSTNE